MSEQGWQEQAAWEYIRGKESVQALARRLGLPLGPVRYRAGKEKWSAKRRAYRRGGYKYTTDMENQIAKQEIYSTEDAKMLGSREESSTNLDLEVGGGIECSTGKEKIRKNCEDSSTCHGEEGEKKYEDSTWAENSGEITGESSTLDSKQEEISPISSKQSDQARTALLYAVADRLLERLAAEVGQERLFSEKSFLRQVTGSLKDLKDILDLKPGKEEGREKFRIAMDKEWEEFSQ